MWQMTGLIVGAFAGAGFMQSMNMEMNSGAWVVMLGSLFGWLVADFVVDVVMRKS